jgi:hypothetical protein
MVHAAYLRNGNDTTMLRSVNVWVANYKIGLNSGAF